MLGGNDRSRGSTPTRTKSPSIGSHHDDHSREVPVQGRDGNRVNRGGQRSYQNNQNRQPQQNRYPPRQNEERRQQGWNQGRQPWGQARDNNRPQQPRQPWNRPNYQPRTPRPMPVAPTVQQLEDFDFEKANAEFVELTSKVSDLKVGDAETGSKGIGENEDNAEPAETYNKTKSFFDSISCEAIERSKG